jgi:hypothetical protein
MKTMSLCHPDRPQVSKSLRCCARCYNALKYGGSYHRAAVRKCRYGITEAEFEQQKQKQENRCAICRVEFSETVKPCIDHNHATESRRGLLCQLCNRGLGYFKDNPAFLIAAIRYLEEYNEQAEAKIKSCVANT